MSIAALFRPIRCKITGFTIESDDVVLYQIRLECMGAPYPPWTVSHRYNNFFDLYQEVEKCNAEWKIDLPKFPKKSIRIPLTGATSNNFVEKRRNRLEEYLRALLSYPWVRKMKLFCAFIALEEVLAFREVVNTLPLNSTVPVFGAPLEEAMQRPENQGAKTPYPLRAAIEFLETNGLDEEGLFRISAQKSAVDICKEMFNRGRIVDFDCFPAGAHVAAAVLKLYLRSLPEPLFTFKLYDTFCQAMGENADDTGKMKALTRAFSLLPTVNCSTLLLVLSLLRRVSAMSDKNKMSTSNLVTIFGSLMLRTDDSGFSGLNGDAAHAYMAISFMIDRDDMFNNDLYSEEILAQVYPPGKPNELKKCVRDLNKQSGWKKACLTPTMGRDAKPTTPLNAERREQAQESEEYVSPLTKATPENLQRFDALIAGMKPLNLPVDNNNDHSSSISPLISPRGEPAKRELSNSANYRLPVSPRVAQRKDLSNSADSKLAALPAKAGEPQIATESDGLVSPRGLSESREGKPLPIPPKQRKPLPQINQPKDNLPSSLQDRKLPPCPPKKEIDPPLSSSVPSKTEIPVPNEPNQSSQQRSQIPSSNLNAAPARVDNSRAKSLTNIATTNTQPIQVVARPHSRNVVEHMAAD